MTNEVNFFMLCCLLQYLERKGILDNPEFRNLCHEALNQVQDEDRRKRLEPVVAQMSMFGWKPETVD